MAQMDWLYINAIGGIGVQVADEDYETAREILDSEPAPTSESAAEPEVYDPVVQLSDSLLFRVARVILCILLLLCFALGILSF